MAVATLKFKDEKGRTQVKKVPSFGFIDCREDTTGQEDYLETTASAKRKDEKKMVAEELERLYREKDRITRRYRSGAMSTGGYMERVRRIDSRIRELEGRS